MILLGPSEAIPARILLSEVVFVPQNLGPARIGPSEVVFVLPESGRAGPARVKKIAGRAPDRDES